MPELPEVETVRRMLEEQVLGRVIASARISGARLRGRVPREVPARVRGRRIERLERHGKYLLIGLVRGVTLLSHLGTACVGVVSDGSAVPDPDVLVECLVGGFDDVLSTIGVHATRSS